MALSNQNKASVPPFTVGDYRVDPGVNQIQDSGVHKQVEPKAMAVLCYLAGRAGETIGREELMTAVWPGRVVVEETLTRAISQLRTALSDNVGSPRYIQTVPKQGYRLIATVGESAADARPGEAGREATVQAEPIPLTGPLSTPSGAGRKAVLAASAAAVLGALLYLLPDRSSEPPRPLDTGPVQQQAAILPARPSVAVLPFRNLGADAESEYFAEGIAEELLNALAGVPGLRVPSRRSSFAFKGKDAELSTIAGQLQVRHVLEGSVRRSGDTVRISTQLIDVGTDTTLWSHQYDRQLEDIFTVQEEIAHQVARRTQCHVS